MTTHLPQMKKQSLIGISSSSGKMNIHSGGHSTTSWSGGTQDQFLESMAEAAQAVHNDKQNDGGIVYISVMNHLSVDCDCDGNPAKPEMNDVGILASTDTVALDQACIDLVYAQKDGDGKSLVRRIESRNGLHTLEQADKIGLGSRSYQLMSINGEEEQSPQMSYANGAVTINNLSSKAHLIHASYRNGILDGVEILEAENGTKTVTAYKGDKFFLWDSVGTMKPLHTAVTVNEGAEPPEIGR